VWRTSYEKDELEALERTGGFELRMTGDDGQTSVAVD
jgi:hypothetical protein